MDDRRRITLEMHKQNRLDIEEIKGMIKTGEGHMQQHFKEDIEFQKRTDEALQQLNELAPIIKEKLIPAWQREQQDEMAWAWLKQRATSVTFWLKSLTTLGAFVLGIIWLLSKLTPKA